MKQARPWYVLALFLITFSALKAQDEKVQIISVQDLSSKDYYSLKKEKEEDLGFKIIETCIPKGLIAIVYLKEQTKKEQTDKMQVAILEKIDRMASPTAYTIEDMRQACAAYREALND